MMGCFVDIAQQDGTPVRMFYQIGELNAVQWIGHNETMAAKFNLTKEESNGRI